MHSAITTSTSKFEVGLITAGGCNAIDTMFSVTTG